uniref:ZAD domain-containing protein n=1 Tax=Anopheles quadriannulatus TaxID=34691 RepID=A0A182WWH1_ANOQN
IPTSYIANCRLCLGTEFGNRCTTIIDESLITMMKQVFPIVIVNQIGLPMNVCTECVKTVEAFYMFSSQKRKMKSEVNNLTHCQLPKIVG